MVNYLIPYIDPKKNNGEEDPLFAEFTYGDKGKRGEKLKDVKKGDYLFFHTSKNHKRYITAFYEVEEVMPIANAKNDPLIKTKYKNPHLLRKNEEPNEMLVFGHPIRSCVLENPLELNTELLEILDIPFDPYTNPTVFGSLTSKFRNWYKVSDSQVTILKKMIFQISQERFSNPEKLLSSDEIPLLLERDIEDLIAHNPTLIGPDLVVKDRQYIFQESGRRLDLLLENSKTSELTIVEIKKDLIDPKVIHQLKDYIEEYKKEKNLLHVNGVIVCKGVLPYFEEKILQSLDKYQWKLFNYGWKFSLENPYPPFSIDNTTSNHSKLQLSIVDNSEKQYQLRLVNNSNEDFKHIRFNFSEQTSIPTDKYFSELNKGQSIELDFPIVELEHEMNYEISYITPSIIQTVKFSHNHLQNISPLEWEVLPEEENSIPTKSVLNLIIKHAYETEPPLNNNQYKKLIKKQCNLEALFQDFYHLVNEYYHGQFSNSDIRMEIAELLQSHYNVSFAQSEGTEILLSCCAACITYFRLSMEQLASVFMENRKYIG